MKLAAKMYQDFANGRPLMARIHIHGDRPRDDAVSSEAVVCDLSDEGIRPKTTLAPFPGTQIQLELPGFGTCTDHVASTRYAFVDWAFANAVAREHLDNEQHDAPVILGRFPSPGNRGTTQHDALAGIPTANGSAPGLALGKRVGSILLITTVLWLPIIGAAWMLFA